MAVSELEVSVKGVHYIPKLRAVNQNLDKNFEIILWKSSFFNKDARKEVWNFTKNELPHLAFFSYFV